MNKLLFRGLFLLHLFSAVILCSCSKEKDKDSKPPVIPKALSSISYTPKANLTPASQITVSAQITSLAEEKEKVQVDSVVTSWNGTELLRSHTSDFSLTLEEINPGKQEIIATVYLSNGKSEKHYLRLTLFAPSPPVTYSYRKIRSYTHDPDAYTQGLFVHDGYLYESTGKEGKSTLRKVDLETGKVVRQVNLDDKYFGEGITLYKNQIIQLTYTTHVGFVYDLETFERVRTFNYPTEGWGIETLGEYLIMTDGSENIYFMDPQTFVEKRRIQVYNHEGKVDHLNELEVIEGKIYANVYQTDRIVIIDPETGIVDGEINLQGILNTQAYNRPLDVLNGIAWDQKKKALYVTGKLWPKLFQIELVKIPS